MWEKNKHWIIAIVIGLAILNGIAIYYKVILPKMQNNGPQTVPTSPFDQPHGASSYSTDNGQMSLLPRTQPFVTAPGTQQYGGIYEKPNEQQLPVQDYSSWSVDWERSRQVNQ